MNDDCRNEWTLTAKWRFTTFRSSNSFENETLMRCVRSQRHAKWQNTQHCFNGKAFSYYASSLKRWNTESNLKNYHKKNILFLLNLNLIALNKDAKNWNSQFNNNKKTFATKMFKYEMYSMYLTIEAYLLIIWNHLSSDTIRLAIHFLLTSGHLSWFILKLHKIINRIV